MTPTPGTENLDPLAVVVLALERGDWRAAWPALFDGAPVGAEREIDLIVALRCVARSMRHQCASGDVQAAEDQLDTAVRMLRQAATRRSGGPVRRIERLTVAVTRLVQRESADLLALQRAFVDLSRGRAELAHAAVEWLTWVEFDPWTVRRHPRERDLLRLDDAAYARFHTANRRDLCDRSTRLRQFADPFRGSVTEKVWQRMGGYPAVREAALQLLAAQDLTRGRADLPVRLGRRRAWEYARCWSGDISD